MGQGTSKVHSSGEEYSKPASPAVEGIQLRPKILKRRSHSPMHIINRPTVSTYNILATFLPIGLFFLVYHFQKL